MSPKELILYLKQTMLVKDQRKVRLETAATAEAVLSFPRVAPAGAIRRLGRWLAPLLLLVADYVTIVAALLTAFWVRRRLLPGIFPDLPYFTFSRSYLYFVLPFIYLTLLFYERLYQKRLPFWQSAERIFKACCYATVISVGVLYFSRTAGDVSRIFVAASGLIAFAYLAVSRYVTKRALAAAGLWQKPVIVVGDGKTAGLLAKAFAAEPNMGYRIAGLVTDDTGLTLEHSYPVIGAFATAEEAIRASGVKDVILAAPELNRDDLLKLVDKIRPLVSELSIMPNLSGVPLSNIEVESFFDQQTVLLKIKNNLLIPSNRISKRLLDIGLGLIISVAVIPLVLFLSIIIKLDSPGPAIFTAKRLGRKGKEFNCYKFRTMYINNDQILQAYLEQNPAARDEWEKYAKLKSEDPRVTRLGRFLRKTSLDELPQIFNVLKGEMSLVGPRPYLPRELERMSYHAATILEVTPGITGLWQVSGRNDIEFQGRLQLDSWYVRNWSVWLDLALLFRTVKAVLARKGAY